MSEQMTDTETSEKKDLKHIEQAIVVLWEKARQVSDIILRLKSENKELQNRISSLEGKERRSAEELLRRDKELEDVRAQLSHAQTNGSRLFSKEESEVVKSRLKELIGKINSRL